MRCYVKNKRGSTLVFVMLVMLVLTVLCTSILTVALANTRTTITQENNMKAYYLARSGAVTLAEHIVADPSVVSAAMISAGSTSQIAIADGRFSVDVDEVDGDLVISSTGIVNNVKDTVKVVLEKSIGRLLDYTVLAENEIHINNHVTVEGDVATNAADISAVDTKPSASPQAEDVELDAKVEIPEIVIPDSYDDEYESVITSDEEIEVSGTKRVYLAGGVDLANGKVLSVTGSGTLHLYLSNGWQSANHSEFVADPGILVILYVIDEEDVYIRSSEFNGIIYAPHSTVTFHNSSASASGGRNFYGSIIADNVYLTGNHTVIEPNPDYDPADISIELAYGIKGIY